VIQAQQTSPRSPAPPNAGCCHLLIGEFNEIILEMLAVYFESFPGVLLTQFFYAVTNKLLLMQATKSNILLTNYSL